MPTPINVLRTRVIETENGFVVQGSTDMLTWFDLSLSTHTMAPAASVAAMTHFLAAEGVPSQGKVVWTP